MGFNTTLLILNDGIDAIERDLTGWWERVRGIMAGLGVRDQPVTVSAGSHANPSQVVAVEHADTYTVSVTGGNYSSVLGKFHMGGGHHTEEDQLAILRLLAEERGYKLVKKPERKPK